MYTGFLKEVCKDLIEHYKTLFLKIVQEGKVSTTWKNAEVKPIYKKGNKQILETTGQ